MPLNASGMKVLFNIREKKISGWPGWSGSKAFSGENAQQDP
jgi:hypothetical protein